MKWLLIGIALSAGLLPSRGTAQQSTISQSIAGTRLDIVATGEVSRVPDVALVSAGVVSNSPTAAGALQDSARRMARVITSLKRAGVADGDIQTRNISLNPEYRYPQNETPQLTGYSAANSVTVRLRNLSTSAAIVDALVSQGANQINGPTLIIDRPEAALDEAREKAVAIGRARAELYARSLGMRVSRVISVNETEQGNVQPPVPLMMEERAVGRSPKVEPGEQRLRVSVAMTFELQ